MGVYGQMPGAQLGETALPRAIGHDVGPIVEVVPQSESVSQFMGCSGDEVRVDILPQHRPSTISRPLKTKP